MLVVRSLNECMKQCVARTTCLSLNYRRQYPLCELLSEETGQFVKTTLETGHCVHILRSSIPEFKELADCECSRQETCSPINKQCVITECPYFNIVNGFVKGNMNQIGAVCVNKIIWNIKRYMGCYEDDNDRSLMPHAAEVPFLLPMTIELCIQYCAKYKYAATQYMYQCFCGDYLDPGLRKPEGECSMSCSGNSSQVCGGVWRGSVYKIQ
ncbi:hypothetical protein ACF0H5_005658 [Mactra antiquata]